MSALLPARGRRLSQLCELTPERGVPALAERACAWAERLLDGSVRARPDDGACERRVEEDLRAARAAPDPACALACAVLALSLGLLAAGARLGRPCPCPPLAELRAAGAAARAWGRAPPGGLERACRRAECMAELAASWDALRACRALLTPGPP
jgi:hypothetical protein